MDVQANAVGSGSTAHEGPRETLGATQNVGPEADKTEAVAPSVEAPAAEPTAEAAPTETPAVEPEASKLERAKAAADKAKRIAQRKRAQAQEQAALRQRAEQAAADARRYQEEAKRFAEFQERIKKHPIDVLKEHGVTANAVLDRATEENSTEGQIAAIKRELSAQLEAERSARLALEQRLQRDQQTAHIEREKAKFIAVVSDEKKFPSLSSLPPQFVLAAAQSTYQEAVGKGYVPTDEEVLETLEDLYSSHTTKRTKSANGSQNGTATASGANGKASPAPPRTITNGMASAKASPPVEYDKLDHWGQTEYLARMLDSKKPKA